MFRGLVAGGWFGQVYAEGDEEDEDSDADEPPAPSVKLRGKKVNKSGNTIHEARCDLRCTQSVGGRLCSR